MNRRGRIRVTTDGLHAQQIGHDAVFLMELASSSGAASGLLIQIKRPRSWPRLFDANQSNRLPAS
jgi:hypothetical protein